MRVYFLKEEICIIEKTQITYIKYMEIISIETDTPYIVINHDKKKKTFIRKSLVDFKVNLPIYFMSCNQSVIINLYYVSLYRLGKNTTVYLINGDEFYLSRRMRNIFKDKLITIKQYKSY